MNAVPSTPAEQIRRRNRYVLLAIFALFFGSLLFAGALRFSGWRPSGSKVHGQLLQPPGDLRAVVPRLVNGDAYHWNPVQRIWRIAVAPPTDCTVACAQIARQIDTVWQLMGQQSDHVQVLWIGSPPSVVMHGGALQVVQPSEELLAGLPRLQPAAKENPHGVPVYIIDPNGFVILRYAPGFDPSGLRTDLATLTKLM